MNKLGYWAIIFAILFFGYNIAIAGEAHHHHEQQTTSYSSEGVASAIAASQHQFYYGTKSWQGSVAIAGFGSTSAFSFGLAKRFSKTLINGNISNEDGKYGGAIGINWNF